MNNFDELFELDVIEVAAQGEDEQAAAVQAATGSWPFHCPTI
ncbi:hypothetical protein ACX9I7_20610 [Streptomyces sp. L500]